MNMFYQHLNCVKTLIKNVIKTIKKYVVQIQTQQKLCPRKDKTMENTNCNMPQ